MKNRLVLVFLAGMLFLAACATTPTPTENYLSTLALMQAGQTLEAANFALTLSAVENRPTATCALCPTCAPPATATPTPTLTPTPTPAATGSLAGLLGYPSEMNPAQRVVAFNLTTGFYYWVNTVDGQNTWQIDALPAGTYHVLAYLIQNPSKTFYAGYSQAVSCGLNTSCSDHTLIDVVLAEGEQKTGVNPIDWQSDPLANFGWPTDPTQP